MTKQTRVRLFSLLVLLGVLAGILITPASQTADAAICCEACEARYQSCLNGTLYPACGGADPCCYNSVSCLHTYCNPAC